MKIDVILNNRTDVHIEQNEKVSKKSKFDKKVKSKFWTFCGVREVICLLHAYSNDWGKNTGQFLAIHAFVCACVSVGKM